MTDKKIKIRYLIINSENFHKLKIFFKKNYNLFIDNYSIFTYIHLNALTVTHLKSLLSVNGNAFYMQSRVNDNAKN